MDWMIDWLVLISNAVFLQLTLTLVGKDCIASGLVLMLVSIGIGLFIFAHYSFVLVSITTMLIHRLSLTYVIILSPWSKKQMIEGCLQSWAV